MQKLPRQAYAANSLSGFAGEAGRREYEARNGQEFYADNPRGVVEFKPDGGARYGYYNSEGDGAKYGYYNGCPKNAAGYVTYMGKGPCSKNIVSPIILNGREYLVIGENESSYLLINNDNSKFAIGSKGP